MVFVAAMEYLNTIKMTKNELNDHKKCYVNAVKHVENHKSRQLLQTVIETRCMLS